jgi:hypothetical protein
MLITVKDDCPKAICRPLGSAEKPTALYFPSFRARIYDKVMTPNETIYLIHQNSDLLKVWRELSASQKRAVIKACETADEHDLEKIIEEVVDGQGRLF